MLGRWFLNVRRWRETHQGGNEKGPQALRAAAYPGKLNVYELDTFSPGLSRLTK